MIVFNYLIVLISIWVLFFFLFLPIAITHNDNALPGQELGAPDRHYFGLKTLTSLGVAIVITFLYAFFI